LAAGTVGTPLIHVGVLHGIDRPRSRPGSPVPSSISHIISRGSSVTQRGRESALHHSTAPPLHHRALPAKGGGSLQAAQMAPSSTSTRVRRARHPELAASPTTTHCVPLSTRDGTRQVRPKDGTGPSLPRPSKACPRTPSFTRRARFPSLIDPGITVSLFSSPGRIPNIEGGKN
jgi:hypothetical protein